MRPDSSEQKEKMERHDEPRQAWKEGGQRKHSLVSWRWITAARKTFTRYAPASALSAAGSGMPPISVPPMSVQLMASVVRFLAMKRQHDPTCRNSLRRPNSQFGPSTSTFTSCSPKLVASALSRSQHPPTQSGQRCTCAIMSMSQGMCCRSASSIKA